MIPKTPSRNPKSFAPGPAIKASTPLYIPRNGVIILLNAAVTLDIAEGVPSAAFKASSANPPAGPRPKKPNALVFKASIDSCIICAVVFASLPVNWPFAFLAILPVSGSMPNRVNVPRVKSSTKLVKLVVSLLAIFVIGVNAVLRTSPILSIFLRTFTSQPLRPANAAATPAAATTKGLSNSIGFIKNPRSNPCPAF